jgi:hypothetical protein
MRDPKALGVATNPVEKKEDVERRWNDEGQIAVN